jgi:hypothetical protein
LFYFSSDLLPGLDKCDFKCVDEVGTVGGEQEEDYDSDKTVDFNIEHIRKVI